MSTAAARRDQVRQSREATRARIVTAAALLLRRRSFAELTVDEVMHEAGQGRTIFYRHFDDLSDLIVRASREAIETLYEAQRLLGAERSSGAPDAIDRALELAVDVYERHGPLLRGVAEAAAGDDQIARGHAEMRRRFDDLAEQWLRAARARFRRATGRCRADGARPEPHERELPARCLRSRAARQPAGRRRDARRALARGHPPLKKGLRPMDVFRTPDERFADLPGYDYAPNYVDVDGLRLHHLDEGSGATVLCFHGEPSWSYLYRHMLDGLVATGHRVVCPDLVGFGKSDKPTDRSWYTYERHCRTVTAHLDQVELEGVTVVVQDWGGSIGLRWAVEHADQVARLVIMNTGLFTGRVSKGFMAWRDFAERTPDLPIGMIIQGATTTDLAPEVVAAYEAPFPNLESKAGRPDVPAARAADRGRAGRRGDARGPGCAEPLGQAGARRVLRQRPGVPVPEVRRRVHRADPDRRASRCGIEGGAHFLQEDRGPQIVDAMLAAFGS